MKKEDLKDIFFTVLTTLIIIAGIGGIIKGISWIRAFKESRDNPVDACEGYESRKKCNFCMLMEDFDEKNFKKCMEKNYSMFDN